jgi:hypothetical protein
MAKGRCSPSESTLPALPAAPQQSGSAGAHRRERKPYSGALRQSSVHTNPHSQGDRRRYVASWDFILEDFPFRVELLSLVPGGDLNPHDRLGSADFTSAMSADFTTRARRVLPPRDPYPTARNLCPILGVSPSAATRCRQTTTYANSFIGSLLPQSQPIPNPRPAKKQHTNHTGRTTSPRFMPPLAP